MELLIENWNLDNDVYVETTEIRSDTKSNFELGIIHHKGLFENKVDFKLAEEFYRKGVEDTDANFSMYNLRFLYEEQGKLNLAEKWYLKAIEKENSVAMNNLRFLYKNQEILERHVYVHINLIGELEKLKEKYIKLYYSPFSCKRKF